MIVKHLRVFPVGGGEFEMLGTYDSQAPVSFPGDAILKCKAHMIVKHLRVCLWVLSRSVRHI